MFILKTKLSAFTLQEMIVVLLLTSILISFVYYALRFMQGDMTRLQTKSNHQTEEMLFIRQLQRDCDACNLLEISTKKISLKIEDQLISYLISDSTVVREYGMMDGEAEKSSKFALSITLLNASEIETEMLKIMVSHDLYRQDTMFIELLPSTKRLLQRQPLQTDSIKSQPWP